MQRIRCSEALGSMESRTTTQSLPTGSAKLSSPPSEFLVTPKVPHTWDFKYSRSHLTAGYTKVQRERREKQEGSGTCRDGDPRRTGWEGPFLEPRSRQHLLTERGQVARPSSGMPDGEALLQLLCSAPSLNSE